LYWTKQKPALDQTEQHEHDHFLRGLANDFTRESNGLKNKKLVLDQTQAYIEEKQKKMRQSKLLPAQKHHQPHAFNPNRHEIARYSEGEQAIPTQNKQSNRHNPSPKPKSLRYLAATRSPRTYRDYCAPRNKMNNYMVKDFATIY
jgi:hypothetical protein